LSRYKNSGRETKKKREREREGERAGPREEEDVYHFVTSEANTMPAE